MAILVAVLVASPTGLFLALAFGAPAFVPGLYGVYAGLRARVPAGAVALTPGLLLAAYLGNVHLTHDTSDHPTRAGTFAAYVAANAGIAGAVLAVLALLLYAAGWRGRRARTGS